MKKLLAMILAVVLVLGMTACAGNDGGVKTYKVGVAIYQYNDNFMTLYRQEIENYFKTLETDTVKYEITGLPSGRSRTASPRCASTPATSAALPMCAAWRTAPKCTMCPSASA